MLNWPCTPPSSVWLLRGTLTVTLLSRGPPVMGLKGLGEVGGFPVSGLYACGKLNCCCGCWGVAGATLGARAVPMDPTEPAGAPAMFCLISMTFCWKSWRWRCWML